MSDRASLTILDGSTFCICDERGDVDCGTTGLFAADTRFVSRFVLTIDGERPLLLTGGNVEHYSAAFFLRNPVAGGLEKDEVSVRRERVVGEGLEERIVLTNNGDRQLELTLGLEIDCDFTDIFTVKDAAFELEPSATPPAPTPPPSVRAGAPQVLIWAIPGFEGSTQVVLSRPATVDGATLRWPVALGPRGTWELDVSVYPSLDRVELSPAEIERHLETERRRVSDSLSRWNASVPRLETSWDDLERAWAQSVSDIAALRIRGDGDVLGQLPAAGMPWFMTVFGRDTLITCLQTFLFGPELATGALRYLAATQAHEDDPDNDAEPGKIVHEVRRGRTAAAWTPRYYGTVDATPLFLVLLSELWRWSGDDALVRELRGAAEAALEWIDRFGDLDGDGFVEYHRRSRYGIRNQSWKDSEDSMRFRDGRLAESPIAGAEIQGYVYDAKLRAAELAREVWGEPETAARLEREAVELRARFDAAFWCEQGWYALALDRDKRKVDGLASNIGHLLWSGIALPERVEELAAHLMSDALWTGWGVRTLAGDQPGYNPLAYHNGTVWPHDNSLIAQGLARYGRWPEALRIARRLVAASTHFDYQLPEVFAGYSRTETPFPVAYPTPARPQAWAAAAPVLLLQVLLGIEADRIGGTLVSRAPVLPDWVGSLRLQGVRAHGTTWDVALCDGRVTIERTGDARAPARADRERTGT